MRAMLFIGSFGLLIYLFINFLNTLHVGDPEKKEGKKQCYSLKIHRVCTVSG